MATLIKQIYLSTEDYGPRKGMLSGTIKFAGQPIQGEVHLTDVERLRATERRVEVVLQLVAVARTGRQQRQQTLPHRHAY